MNTLERMTDKFNTLPFDFQEAIRTFDYDLRLNAISKKHRLHIDQLVHLEKAMSDVVFGDLKAKDLNNTLISEMHIEQTLVNEITIDLNKEILIPLREHIRNIQTKSDILESKKVHNE